ncbi:pmpD [Symbiodinium sp. CCMP2456]|nr:pmpD [Symbiodinium sp. CCMP2456]
MGFWALLISVVAAERTYNNLDANEPSPFPSSCNGSYNLWGNYTVESASVVPGSSCRLNGRFARVLLKAPLIFEGTLNMEGDIAFIGDGSFQQACVTADSVQVGSGTSDDRISFQNCRNMQTSGGGLFVRHELWVNLQASLQVQNCSSRQDGGGIQVEGEVIQFGGHIEIRDCISHSGSAGGLQVGSGLVQLLDSSMSFSRCSARRHGGCLRVMGDLTLEGKVEMQHCESKGMGGAIAATGTFAQDGGAMQFSHCASKLAGGALRAKAFHQSHGYARFVSCAARVGGALYSLEGVQLGGNNVFESCTAGMGGGGIASWGGSLVQRDGSAQFSECQVYTGSGGAVYLPQGSVYQNGSLTFQNCHAQNGGAVFAKGDLRLGGDVSCRNCTAKVMGGAVAVHGNIWQTGKSLVVESCRASESGGGIYVQKSFFQQSGTVSFQNCSSLLKGHGGCLWTAVFNKSGGSTVFRSCFASRGGGALFSAFSVQLTGPTLFADGLAWGDGGCMQIQHGSLVQFGGSTDFARCTTFMAGGGLHVVAGGLTLASGSMSFTNCTGISKGGGALVEQDVESSGNLTFQTCVSNGQDGGGGLLVRQGDLLQRGGTIHLARCTASHGGGVRIQQGSLRVAAGKMSFVQCHATESAGGMLAHSNVHVSSEMTFKGCVAGGARGGGGLLIASGNLTQAGGSLSFEKCAARAGYGGGLNLLNGSLHQKPGGSLLFSRCEARAGGGLAVKRDATLLGFANFRECVARSRDAIRGGGGLYIDYGKLELHGHLEFIQCMTMGNGGAVLVKAGRIATQGNMSIQSCTARRGGGGIYLLAESWTRRLAGWNSETVQPTAAMAVECG